MISHLLCYLKHTLFKARKPWIFKIFSLRPMLNVMPWISETSEIKSITESFWGNRTDLIIYTHFGSNQPPVYVEISTAFLTRETSAIIPKKLLKRSWPIHQIPLTAHFMHIFAAAKASLVIIQMNALSQSLSDGSYLL